MSPLQLERDDHGCLTLIAPDGQRHDNVTVVRCFPLSAPDEGIALVDPHGHQVGWLPRLSDVPAETQALLQEALARRDFIPEIDRLLSVDSFACPCCWKVITDRGETAFTLKGEEDIRRIGQQSLLITDHRGIHFLIRNRFSLDRHSSRLLERFL